jgi:hypothetical protein
MNIAIGVPGIGFFGVDEKLNLEHLAFKHYCGAWNGEHDRF